MTDSTSPNSVLPPFYNSIRPLDKEKDSGKRLRRTTYGFARNINAIPLLHTELPMAAAYYPIVFSESPQLTLTALVGLEPNTNLFIDNDGNWLRDCYVPAYVQRYPFLLLDNPDEKQYILCIDESTDLLNEHEGEALFNNGMASKFIKETMDFCASLRSIGEQTDEFVQTLLEHNLLQKVNVRLPLSDSTLQIEGLQTISHNKIDSLSTGQIIEWHRRGWLALLYALLLSSHRWQNMIQYYEKNRGGNPLPAQPGPQPPSIQNSLAATAVLPQEETEAATYSGFRLLKRPGGGKDF